MKKVILSAVAGGVIFLAWSCISWMVLPWHRNAIHSFKHPEFVEFAIKDNVDKPGMYLTPHCGDVGCDQEKQKGRPFIFAHVIPEGISFNMTGSFCWAIIVNFLGAGLIAHLLGLARLTCYFRRVGFVTSIGVLIGLLGVIPDWIWWHIPLAYILPVALDCVIAAALGGLAIAAIMKPKETA